ncbi:MAG: hypothetical protein HFJ95_08515 [Muribaculaceae bacterium]|nr:hypothetical protein [Muribaculaceae bacterium]
MKHLLFFRTILMVSIVAMLTACGGAPVQSPCSVEVFIPLKQYTQVSLVDQHGKLLDSTLTIAKDSIRFTRDDITSMPYVAKLLIVNPSDSLDMLYMPFVVEGGKVEIEISDVLNLTGTDDNRALFKFIKAKNNFAARYQNPEHDLEKLNRDYSKFYSDQMLVNSDNAVGKYLYETYGSLLTSEDDKRVKEKLK